MDKTLDIELAEIRPKVLATARKFFRASRLDGDPEDVRPGPSMQSVRCFKEGTVQKSSITPASMIR